MAAGITVAVNDKALASLINSMAGWGAIGDIPDTGDVIAGSFYYDTTNSILYQEQNGAWVAVLQTKTLNPANEIVEAGYYAATTLSAVDADLTAANIKFGVNIFGKVGTAVIEGTETFAFATAELAATESYTPAAGIYFLGIYDFCGFQYKYNATWYWPYKDETHMSANGIGDGTNMRIYSSIGGEYGLMRHYYSNGTYERFTTQDIAALGTYTPASAGYYAHGDEDTDIRVYLQLGVHGWTLAMDALDVVGIAISDGTNMYYKNIDAVNAYETVIMRANMV